MPDTLMNQLIAKTQEDELSELLETNEKIIFALLPLIEKRFEAIENKIFKKRADTTRAQQILLLKHTGLLDKINELDFKTAKAKALFLSLLLNNDADNIEEDLRYIDTNTPLATLNNYQHIADIFDKTGLNTIAEKIYPLLNKARSKEEEAKHRKRK